ncbi:MAG: hypothetical protein ACI9XR_001505 [Flavobacterium sp.]|jgi:hypothetical protein
MKTSVQLAEELLLAIKKNEEYDALVETLAKIELSKLKQDLNTENKKKSFWINCYNAFYQIEILKDNSKTVYRNKTICIGNQKISLDEIEHGILRKGKFVIGFGYLNNPLYSGFIKNLQVLELDYRIHFALNCGAISCPAIAFYTSENLDKELDLAMHSFLLSETTLDEKQKTIITSKLLYWYLGDFMGKKGIKEIVSSVFKINLNTYKLQFTNYDWTPKLKNFRD